MTTREDNLVAARNMYLRCLQDDLTPFLMSLFRNLYAQVPISGTSKYFGRGERSLKEFQGTLKDVKGWNGNIVRENASRLEAGHTEKHFEHLLTALLVSNAEILSSVRMTETSAKINLKIPKIENFLHDCVINVARMLYKNTFLFEEGTSNVQKQKHNQEFEALVKHAVEITAQKALPVQEIIRMCVASTNDSYENSPQSKDGDADRGETIVESITATIPDDTNLMANGLDAAGHDDIKTGGGESGGSAGSERGITEELEKGHEDSHVSSGDDKDGTLAMQEELSKEPSVETQQSNDSNVQADLALMDEDEDEDPLEAVNKNASDAHEGTSSSRIYKEQDNGSEPQSRREDPVEDVSVYDLSDIASDWTADDDPNISWTDNELLTSDDDVTPGGGKDDESGDENEDLDAMIRRIRGARYEDRAPPSLEHENRFEGGLSLPVSSVQKTKDAIGKLSDERGESTNEGHLFLAEAASSPLEPSVSITSSQTSSTETKDAEQKDPNLLEIEIKEEAEDAPTDPQMVSIATRRSLPAESKPKKRATKKSPKRKKKIVLFPDAISADDQP